MNIRILAMAAAVAVMLPAARPTFAQSSFEQATTDLASADAATRLRAVRLLGAAAYPESAEPIAATITDADDRVQLEAIQAELNIYLADKVVPRRRVGYLVEVRSNVDAASVFAAGPRATIGQAPPAPVLTALRTAIRDDNPRVGLDALYALGTLGYDASGAARRDLLRGSGPELAALVGSPDRAVRLAAVRVIGRLFAHRDGDAAVDPAVGDAVIIALNDSDRATRVAAMDALGAMRYERALQALTELFDYYQRGEDGVAALDALAHLGHASSAPRFMAALASKDAALRATAIEGLARVGDRTKLAEIDHALTSERDETVLLAAHFASAMLANAPIDTIVDALGRPKLRDRAVAYLIELAPGRTSSFARLAQDPDARLRADVADVLGMARDRAAFSIVEPLLRDGDSEVAQAAARAAARLR